MKTKCIYFILMAFIECVIVSGCKALWQKSPRDYPGSVWETNGDSFFEIEMYFDENNYLCCNLKYEMYYLECYCFYGCDDSLSFYQGINESVNLFEANRSWVYDDDKFDIITTESDLLKIFDIESDNTEELRITLTRVK